MAEPEKRIASKLSLVHASEVRKIKEVFSLAAFIPRLLAVLAFIPRPLTLSW